MCRLETGFGKEEKKELDLHLFSFVSQGEFCAAEGCEKAHLEILYYKHRHVYATFQFTCCTVQHCSMCYVRCFDAST